MISPAYAVTMARYNDWMNRRLYALCAGIDDAERRRDRGAFFGSIHRSLDHIVYADLAFLSRFTGTPAQVPELGPTLYEDFDALRDARAALDARLLEWSATLTEPWLAQDLTYTSNVDGVARSVARWTLVVHVFNHQTHHRGQVTTLLSQMGLDIGSTDLPFMPAADAGPGSAGPPAD